MSDEIKKDPFDNDDNKSFSGSSDNQLDQSENEVDNVIEKLLSSFDLPIDSGKTDSDASLDTSSDSISENDNYYISDEEIFSIQDEVVDGLNNRPEINFDSSSYQESISKLNEYEDLLDENQGAEKDNKYVNQGIQEKTSVGLEDNLDKIDLVNILNEEDKLKSINTDMKDTSSKDLFGKEDLGYLETGDNESSINKDDKKYDLDDLNVGAESENDLSKTFEEALSDKKYPELLDQSSSSREDKEDKSSNVSDISSNIGDNNTGDQEYEFGKIFDEGFDKLNIDLEHSEHSLEDVEENQGDQDNKDSRKETFSINGNKDDYLIQNNQNFNLLKENKFFDVLNAQSNAQSNVQNNVQNNDSIEDQVNDSSSIKEKEEVSYQDPFIFDDDTLKQIDRNLDLLPLDLQSKIHNLFLSNKLSEEETDVLMNFILGNNQEKIRSFVDQHYKILKEKTKQKYFLKFSRFFLPAIFVFILFFSFILFFKYTNDLNNQTAYNNIISELDKGVDHYQSANQKFMDFYNKNKDISYIRDYIQKYLNLGDPLALYYAHNFLLGREISNENWKDQYVTEFENLKNNRLRRNRIEAIPEKTDLYTKKDSENVLGKSTSIKYQGNIFQISGLFDFYTYLRSKLGWENSDPDDYSEFLIEYGKSESVLNMVIKLFQKKAYWAYYYNNWDNVDFFFQESLDRGYNDLMNVSSSIILNDLSRLALFYTRWGTFLKEYDSRKSKDKYDQARKIYDRISKEYPKSRVSMYGILNIYIQQKNSKKAFSIFERLYSGEEGFSKLNFDNKIEAKIINNYFGFLLNTTSLEKNTRLKNKLLRDLFYLLNNSLSLGYISPEIYYNLGDYIFKKGDYYYALEIYIKGLFSFYFNDLSKLKQFMNQIQNTSKKDYVYFLRTMTMDVVRKIRVDFDIEHFPLKSNFFTKISESFANISLSMNSNIFSEEDKRKFMFDIAKKNIELAIQIDPRNKSAWYNKADLYYSSLILENQKLFNNGETDFDVKKIDIKSDKIKQYYMNILYLSINRFDLLNKSFLKDLDLLDEVLIKIDIKNIEYGRKIFYHLGVILYYEGQYELAYKFLQALKEKFEYYQLNIKLNFALGNVLLYLGNYSEAIKNYEKIINFYVPAIEKSKKNFSSTSLKKIKIFLNVAKVYNNVGLAYHLRSEKFKSNYVLNQNLRRKALYYYYCAREYASFISHLLVLKSQKINMKRIFDNIVFLETSSVDLSKRKSRKKDIYLQPLKHMIIRDIDLILG